MSSNITNPSSTTVKNKISKNEKNLVVSFIQFLRHKVSANEFNQEQSDSLEVAVQYLERAFDVSDKNYAFQPSKTLLDIFTTAEGLPQSEEEDFPEPTQAEIDQANKLKEEGNELVKADKLEEAIIKYNEAIQLNRDPIYFCNRAAAYCRQEQYDLAIQDCRTALALESNYAKAYGRMGLALSCQNRYDEAYEAYKKALEIDPNNESYKQNLAIAEEKLKEARTAFGGNNQSSENPFNGFNFASFLNNPNMVQSATQLFSNPEFQEMLSGFVNQFNVLNGNTNFESLLRLGETFFQQVSPELLENFRRTANASNTNNSNSNQNNGNNDSNNAPPS